MRCRLEKRLRVPRCTKCWSYDHRTDNCTGPERRENCYRCGKESHSSNECTNEEACPLCEETGHRAGTSQCLAFKAALKRVRNAERRKKQTPTPTGILGETQTDSHHELAEDTHKGEGDLEHKIEQIEMDTDNLHKSKESLELIIAKADEAEAIALAILNSEKNQDN